MTDEKRVSRALHSKNKNELLETMNFLYDKYKPLLSFIVAKYIHNDADIEDIVQDTFLDFFNAIESVRSSIKGYLSISAKHNAFDFLKKNNRISYVSVEEMSSFEDISEPTYSNEKLLKLIEHMKSCLAEEDVNIILYHLLDQMKFKDIADKLNSNERSVKTRYYRALKKYQTMNGVKEYEKR
ncbi:MAG: sigma-70 family RNA polymerase sigma factor [Anaeroplasmataceae bacterium]|nr:sigma-70 family RNA polymerase sigma factor [Anaeroplasmataceae bacterium]